MTLARLLLCAHAAVAHDPFSACAYDHGLDLQSPNQADGILAASPSNANYYEQKVPWDHRHNARVWATEPHRLADYNRVDLDLTHELFMRVLRGEPLFLGDTTVVLPAPEYKLDDGR